VQLTASGAAFVDLAERYDAIWRETQTLYAGGPKLSLAIGTLDSVINSIFPPVYRALSAHLPPISLKIVTTHSIHAYDEVERRTVDLAFSLLERNHPNVTVRKCYGEEMVVLRRTDGTPDKQGTVDPQELDGNAELHVPWGPGFQSWHERWWDPHCPGRTFLDTAQLVLTFLVTPDKWSIVPYSVARRAQAQGSFSIFHLSARPPERIVYLLTHKQPQASCQESLKIFQWKDAALLLVGHGSSRLATSRHATDRLTEAIRRRALFAEVVGCFWKEAPFLSLDLVQAQTVYVVPNFAGEGFLTRRLIPQKLGITGTLSNLGGRRLIYTQPVGCHPRLPDLLSLRAQELCRRNNIAPQATGLLIVGHGSRQPGAPSATPEAVAGTLRGEGTFARVATAYLEQPPFVGDWPRLIDTHHVIVAPWLISEGMHASEDVPPHFGSTTPGGGPVAVHERTVWLLDSIGRDEEVVEMILDHVRQEDERLAYVDRLSNTHMPHLRGRRR
jgi:sirohydrochlorin ferrochelatase/DNA-binding transcriptional LysR family regulator